MELVGEPISLTLFGCPGKRETGELLFVSIGDNDFDLPYGSSLSSLDVGREESEIEEPDFSPPCELVLPLRLRLKYQRAARRSMPPAATPQTMPAMVPPEVEARSFSGCASVGGPSVVGSDAAVDGACVAVTVTNDALALVVAIDVSVVLAVVGGKSKSRLKGEAWSVAVDPVLIVLVYSVS